MARERARSTDLLGSERRQLTVLYCDIVDSTGLSERKDPEDIETLLHTYRRVCMAATTRFGGHVVGYAGDGILAEFGYPSAMEQTAVAGVRAAISIVENVRDLNGDFARRFNETLAVRIGLYTGEVVVGGVGVGSLHQGSAVVGETPNIAARLQGLAQPNTIVIGSTTEQLLGGQFDTRPLGFQKIKGLKKQIAAFEVIGERHVRDRFVARVGEHFPELVGRQSELRVLVQAWQRTASLKSGEVVVITGDPGMGKSCLLHGFTRHQTEHFMEAGLYGSPDHRNIAFYPFIELLRQLVSTERFVGTASDSEPLVNLFLTYGLSPIEGLNHLMGLLDPASSEGSIDRTLEAQQVRRATRTLLRSIVVALAKDQPLLLVVEDAQWFDPTSLDLVERLLSALPGRQIMATITSRTELTIKLPASVPVTRIELDRLDKPACVELVSRLDHGHVIADEVVQRIVTRSDGVALFVEELTRAVLETGALPSTPTSTRKSTAGDFEGDVPASLRDSLMARLDRLADAKRVAQLAATVGRVFRYDLLALLYHATSKSIRLDQILTQLSVAGIIIPVDAPNRTYAFKHALLRDVAYGSLLRRQRRAIHEVIADAIEARFPDIAKGELDLLAQHRTLAHQNDRAARLWLQAARISIARSADLEAIAQIASALEQIALLPTESTRDDLELDAHIAMIGPLVATKGYGSPEVGRTIDRALMLCRNFPGDPRIFPALYCRWSYEQLIGRVEDAYSLASEFQAIAEAQLDTGPRIIGNRLLGTAALVAGKPISAIPLLEQAMALYDPAQHKALAYTYGTDFHIMSACHLAFALWHIGALGRAAKLGQQALTDAISFGHTNTLCYALSHLCLLYAIARDFPQMESVANQLFALASERELPFWAITAGFYRGWSEVCRGDVNTGLATLVGGLEFRRRTKVVYWMPTHLTWLAQAHAIAGDPTSASKMIEEAQAVMDHGGEKWFEPECWRVKAELLMQVGEERALAAEHLLQRSIALARANGEISFALRSAISLARVWQLEGRTVDGERMLGEALRPFALETAGADQLEAQSLLGILTAQNAGGHGG